LPYGLKNALPTFVCAMHKIFRDLIRDMVEVYVDDIIVKNKSHPSLSDNLAIVFGSLRSTRMMLKPNRCVFRVSAGKLLGFLVSHQGIEANPEKIKAIEEMRPPARIKDVQKLTGCLTVLNWFISRLAKRALPFFKLLWKSGPFIWIEEVDEAFQELKQYLTSLSIMVAPEPSEHLLLYIAATTKVISMVLVVEWPEPKQPQVLRGAPAVRSRSQDSNLADGRRDQDAFGSQISERTLSPKPQIGSRLPEVPRVPRTKRLSARRSQSPLWVLTDSAPPSPSPWRCPRVLGPGALGS
jgi:hypothetical protein